MLTSVIEYKFSDHKVAPLLEKTIPLSAVLTTSNTLYFALTFFLYSLAFQELRSCAFCKKS